MIMKREQKIIDGNEAVSHVAYQTNEVIAIYPITPASPMGEWSDAWSAEKKPNIWGIIPRVVEMQSEGGAAGAIHGALQTGALATTFTASQGLLLMIPNMYKIAGELTPFVLHVAARSLAAQGLSIFGDHSDVMAARATGFAMLCSASVQEAMDLALIAQQATFKARIPFLHFFDGFRTSHELSKIEMLTTEDMKVMLDEEYLLAHRHRALSPDHPVLRGTAQNPDVYFQARETVNPFYLKCLQVVKEAMARFAKLTGRQYHLFDYYGHPQAEKVIVLMGSGCETVQEMVDYWNDKNAKVGVLKVRLYRPFSITNFLGAMPKAVQKIAVLDRTKEPGSIGEPLYLDCVNAFYEGIQMKIWKNPIPVIVGGRYGLSSKEFTPAMVTGIFDHLEEASPKNHFTVGIEDDVTHSSISFDHDFYLDKKEVFEALFYGLGSDGTVGANKNTIKIIGESTDNFVQGYFVYDSKKAGAMTVSHLRFGSIPIHSPYLVQCAEFVGCHQGHFLETVDVLKYIDEKGVFLLNSPYGPNEVWEHLPEWVKNVLIQKKCRFYVIDAYQVAQKAGMSNRINTIMQVCFFAISGVLERAKAIDEIKKAIRKTYESKGEDVITKNLNAVDLTLDYLHKVHFNDIEISEKKFHVAMAEEAPRFVNQVLGKMIAQKGDELKVSELPCDGTYPTGTSQWEKRNLAHEIPVWEPDICIQCGKCAFVCPHSVIRIKAYPEDCLKEAPAAFKYCDGRKEDWNDLKYTIQVAPEDCTGCGICVDICPAKSKSQSKLKAIHMELQSPLIEQERKNWDYFLKIPEFDRRQVNVKLIRHQQVQQPLFEFPSACSGCGETPYIKLVSQLFGDRAIIANATGCSSIYGGNLPTTPWSKNQEGRGPAWCNSLFEDNAEFGYGMRVSIDTQREYAGFLLRKIAHSIGDNLVQEILEASQKDEADIFQQRERVAVLKIKLSEMDSEESRALLALADIFVKKSIWIIGGDGWAYDIGFGGLDHVLANHYNVNILVLDTEVYSNTGGQMSKATPLAAIAKFAAGGKRIPKKDLGLMAMTYGHVYVAQVAMGAKDEHTLKAFLEAEAYEGPSLIIAYSHCIAHGINMTTAMQNQKAMVNCGQWTLYRYHPEKLFTRENPFSLDSRITNPSVEQYLMMENRFKALTKTDPQAAKELFSMAAQNVKIRRRIYEYLAQGQWSQEQVLHPAGV